METYADKILKEIKTGTATRWSSDDCRNIMKKLDKNHDLCMLSIKNLKPKIRKAVREDDWHNVMILSGSMSEDEYELRQIDAAFNGVLNQQEKALEFEHAMMDKV